MSKKKQQKNLRKKSETLSSKEKGGSHVLDVEKQKNSTTTKPHSAQSDSKGFFARMFGKKNKEKEHSHQEEQEELLKSFENLKREVKKKKVLEKRQIFTFKGFLRAIDLQVSLEKAGITTDPKLIEKKIIKASINIVTLICIFIGAKALTIGASFLNLVLYVLGFFVVLFIPVLVIIWFSYLFYLDMKIYQRKKEVERVFPDFLQLASSNISAGMPIDQALWYAMRPNFGVLAKEIETVAKNTIAGEDLTVALEQFAQKYDSKVIQRSVSLILEGLAAGGELADLLNKIALDIEETRILKQDMAANVTTYVIFITFATIVASPVLLGLSTQLLEIITKITAQMGQSIQGSSSSFFSFSFSSDGSSIKNFKIFSYVMLCISSISAACIVTVIQKGNVKDGLPKIPMFIAVSLTIYFISSYVMSYLFSSLI